MKKYNFLEIEQTVQNELSNNNYFCSEIKKNKKKFYCLSMFPYPSGKLHMGHVRNYTIGDIIARYQRMKNKNVLHPMGWDSFGLPAENAAIKNKEHPKIWTNKNIEYMKKQLKVLGLSYDWSREISTCNSSYYKWEQWLFIQMYNKNLVYKKQSIVNWDPVDQTILANEQVINGKGWRSNADIEKKYISQWFLKITSYADELLDCLKKLKSWPNSVKKMQKEWIGKTEGVQIILKTTNYLIPKLNIFIDKIYLIMAINCIFIQYDEKILKKLNNKDIQEFITKCKNNKQNQSLCSSKFANFYAIHPISNEKLPIYIGYDAENIFDTKIRCIIPENNLQDLKFTKQNNLKLTKTLKHIKKTTNNSEKILLQNSYLFNNLTIQEAEKKILKYLINKKIGKKSIKYKIHDWGISRQRRWGCPIPIIYCTHCGIVTEKENNLPVLLPKIKIDNNKISFENYENFVNITCPYCKSKAKRETDTFDTFVESSWYYIRYTKSFDNKNNFIINPEEANYWLPVDHYIGGIEHANLHLLYARFLYKIMRDINIIKDNEPFIKLLTQGMVLKDGSKMSKSKNNIVDPQVLINNYGADTLRLYIIFSANPEQNLEWSDDGIKGIHRFLTKVWNFYNEEKYHLSNIKHKDLKLISNKEKQQLCEINIILDKINNDMKKNQFNTVISFIMKIFKIINNNNISKFVKNISFIIIIKTLSPFAPHISQYIWKKLNINNDIYYSPWPRVNQKLINSMIFIKLIIQINGKFKQLINIKGIKNITQYEAEIYAKKETKIYNYLYKKNIINIIYIPNKLINFIIE